jgi:hypothetical protein
MPLRSMVQMQLLCNYILNDNVDELTGAVRNGMYDNS